MANPSLQIGNDNWAIKEDNLLGYSTAGTRFVPQPITMTRATAGTRVNPSGLVEDVELLGSEEVTNGDFATDSDWSKFDGTTISGGAMNFNVTNTGTKANQTNVMTNGLLYKVTFEISNYVVGNIYMSGWNIPLADRTEQSNGIFSFYAEANSSTFTIGTTSSSTQLSVNNISVKEATIDNLPRVDYTDGTSSLLVEPQRTNLITYSEDFTSWNKLAAIVTTNQTTSPSGTLTADKITYDGTTYGRVEQTVAVTNGNTYSWSVYLKNNDLSDVTQVWLGFSQAGQGEFVTITNEWQRYETVQVANGSNEYPRVQFTGTGSLYAWGAQLEQGSYPTSYIPTSGSTVTRNQETYEKTGISDLINSEEGVLFAEVSALVEVDTARRFITLNDGGASNNVVLRYEATGVITARYQVGGVAQCSIAFATTITNSHKIAFKYKVNDFALWIDGTEVGTDTSGSVLGADTINKISFDSGNGSFPFYGKVKQLQVFKTALSDSELETLTT